MSTNFLGSEKPIILDVKIKCPVDDTGINSVKPSTIATIIALIINKISNPTI